MIGSLLTLPVRAAYRAVCAAVSTEPVPTILFGAAEPLDDDPRYSPGMTLTLPYDESMAARLHELRVGQRVEAHHEGPTVRVKVDGVELGRWEQMPRHRETCQ